MISGYHPSHQSVHGRPTPVLGGDRLPRQGDRFERSLMFREVLVHSPDPPNGDGHSFHVQNHNPLCHDKTLLLGFSPSSHPLTVRGGEDREGAFAPSRCPPLSVVETVLLHSVALHSLRESVHFFARLFRSLLCCMNHAHNGNAVNSFDNAVNRIHAVNSRGQNRTKSNLPQSSTIAREIFCGFLDLFTICLLMFYIFITIVLAG